MRSGENPLLLRLREEKAHRLSGGITMSCRCA